jgi:multiple sugar transport system substrate-binding protein
MLNPELQFIVDTYTTAYSQITQIYKEENEMYFLGATTLEEYLNNIKTRADEAIAKESN